MPIVEASPQDFHREISAALAASAWGACCHLYSVEEYAAFRTHLADDGLSGFAIIPENVFGDELVSVFSRGGNRLPALLTAAAWHGARRLNTFDTGLVARYALHGWVETERLKWDDQYAPDGWPYSVFGRPDVVYMEYQI